MSYLIRGVVCFRQGWKYEESRIKVRYQALVQRTGLEEDLSRLLNTMIPLELVYLASEQALPR